MMDENAMREIARTEALKEVENLTARDWVKDDPESQRLIMELQNRARRYFEGEGAKPQESSQERSISNSVGSAVEAKDVIAGASMSVVEYRKKFPDLELVRSDILLGGGLAPNENGTMAIVKDLSSDNEFVVIPNIERFSSREEYGIYLSDWFDCEDPHSGEVRVIKPAKAEKDEDFGYQVKEKGRIEIK